METTKQPEGRKYDYIIIGSGSAALTVGALLANAGKTVCMLEAHDIPGGYAQNFKWGDFYFCGQVHYIWGCAPGGTVYEFLKKLGLEKDITFELHDADGYDRMSMPDGKVVKIPYGYDRLAENIEAAYPGQKGAVIKFTNILDKIGGEMQRYPDKEIRWWQYITQGWKYLTLLKYKDSTLQDVFNECGLSKEAQLVICAQAGDFMEPPERLSIFAFIGLFAGYNGGAYYPTKHYKYYVDRLAQFIAEHRGCKVFLSHEVTKVNFEGDRAVSVETKNGKVFTGANIICNADPRKTAEMIGLDKFPADYRKKLDYTYSPSGIMIYLGLKNADLRKKGFGGFNIWHCEGDDMNQMWREMGAGDFSKPWVFLSTPTLHTSERGTVAPADCDIMEIAAYTEFEWLDELRKKDYKAYEAKKLEIADRMIDIMAKRFFPDLRNYIVTKVVGSPSTNVHWVNAPKGNAYGASITPSQMGPGRLKAKSPWKNFFWCNATAGYGGVHGTVSTGVGLYMELTSDKFYDESKMPTNAEKAIHAREAFEKGVRA